MIWGMTLHPGEEFTRKVVSDEHLTLASLECRAERCGGGGRPSACLLLKTERGQHVLCSLEEGVVNQQCLDLILEQGERITFLVEGTSVVYLTGYTSRKRQLSGPIRDHEDTNTGIDDASEGEGHTVSEKDVSDDGEMIQEVSGIHDDDEGNDGDSNQVVCDEESGERDVQIESKGSIDDDVMERTAMDCTNQTDSVIRIIQSVDGGLIVEENADFVNEKHQGVGHDGPGSGSLDDGTALSDRVTKKVGGRNTSSSSRRSKVSSKTKSPRTKTIEEEVEKNPPRMILKHKCFICLKGFAKKSSCRDHERICKKGSEWKNRDQEPYRCRFCGKAFDELIDKQIHEENHPKEEPYECRYCEKRFTSMYTAKKHESIHTRQGRLKCKLCPKTYMTKGHLTEHMRSHTGERPFQCQLCEVYFSSQSAHNRHMRRHESRLPFHCITCNKSFSSQNKLDKHMRIHTETPRYRCRHCDKAFVVHYHRARHEKKEHTPSEDIFVGTL